MSDVILAEIREHFQEVRGAVLTAQIEWSVAKQLFSSGSDNIELLNWSANYAFWAINRALYLDVVMAISRLTDPAKTGRYDNLSLHRLAAAIEEIDFVMGKSIKESLQAAKSTFEPLRAVRDRKFAHSDLVDFKLTNLPGAESVDKAIEALINISNEIKEAIGIGIDGILLKDISHYHFQTWGNGEALLYKLRKYKELIDAS
jgi:hypothetical protein